MSYADAVTREAAWFQAVGVVGLPDVAGVGGQFDVVDAYPRRLAQAPRQCWLYRHGATDHPEARTRGRMLHHHFMAIVWWPRRLGAERAMTEQQSMDNAIDVVVQRARGIPSDTSHGGAFFSQVGDIVVTNPDPATMFSVIDAPGALGLGWTALVSYTMAEWIG